MHDRDFLIWLHKRLTEKHGESAACDYMHKLRAIIRSTPADRITPNVATSNSLQELLEQLKN